MLRELHGGVVLMSCDGNRAVMGGHGWCVMCIFVNEIKLLIIPFLPNVNVCKKLKTVRFRMHSCLLRRLQDDTLKGMRISLWRSVYAIYCYGRCEEYDN